MGMKPLRKEIMGPLDDMIKVLWEGGIDNKPSYDVTYITLSLVLAQRSMDTSTVHGCFLVADDKGILACGYNGPIKGSIDENIPMTRPEKYCHMIHSEENCMIAYDGDRGSIAGATMYISGPPCHRCMRMMLQKGIRNFVLGTIGSHCIDEADEAAKVIMLENKSVNIKQFTNEDMDQVIDLLERTKNYVLHKRQQGEQL